MSGVYNINTVPWLLSSRCSNVFIECGFPFSTAKKNVSNFNDYIRCSAAKWKPKNKAKHIHGPLKRNTLMEKLIFP